MSIRLFAILAIIGLGLIAIKALSITDEVLSLINPVQPAWAAAKPKEDGAAKKDLMMSEASDTMVEPEVASKRQGPQRLSFAEQAGLSEQELNVVLRLSERREELDKRERGLQIREAVVALSEKQLDERLMRIEGAIAKYDERIGLLDEQETVRISAVVRTYEAMKPKSAAAIFNTLDKGVLLQVSTRMKPSAMAKVLAAMDTKLASDLTVQMAEQFSIPKTAEALLNDRQSAPEG